MYDSPCEAIFPRVFCVHVVMRWVFTLTVSSWCLGVRHSHVADQDPVSTQQTVRRRIFFKWDNPTVLVFTFLHFISLLTIYYNFFQPLENLTWNQRRELLGSFLGEDVKIWNFCQNYQDCVWLVFRTGSTIFSFVWKAQVGVDVEARYTCQVDIVLYKNQILRSERN